MVKMQCILIDRAILKCFKIYLNNVKIPRESAWYLPECIASYNDLVLSISHHQKL